MSSASRASSSRSARRRSRRSPARGASSRPASAAHPSSFRATPACSSIRRTRPSSQRRSAQRPRYRFRTRPRERLPRSTTSGFRRSGWRRSSSEPFEIGEPDLDERPHRVLDPRLARHLERLLVALARLLRRHALLQAVVARDEQPLDLRARLVARWVHIRSLNRQDRGGGRDECEVHHAGPRPDRGRSPFVRGSARGRALERGADRGRRARSRRRRGGRARARAPAGPGRPRHQHAGAGRLRGGSPSWSGWSARPRS